MIFASGCFTNHKRAIHAPRTIGSDHLCPSVVTSSCEITSKNGLWQLPVWMAQAASQCIKPILQHLGANTDNPEYLHNFTRSLKEITGKCQAAHKRVLRWRKNKIDRARLRWVRAHTRAVHCPTDELIMDAERARQTWLKEIKDKGKKTVRGLLTNTSTTPNGVLLSSSDGLNLHAQR